ncbi:MAG: helix-turn-helix transcriptional regulator [Brachymonas sp.]|nr:helix-turn-helix transcriptional regulator [Brachymonas sp.]
MATTTPQRLQARAHPLPVQRALQALAADVSRARRRRRISQQELADRAGLSLNTIKRLESGDGASQLQAFARVMAIVGDVHKLATLLDTAQDDVGLLLMDEQLPQRVRKSKTTQVAF